jgi:hypothetical protein
MCRMKGLLAIALTAACTVAQAQSSALVSEKRVDRFAAAQASRLAKPADPRRKPAAAIAVALTDDADSILLPTFAMRTTPAPIRFLRVGVEWSF